MSLGNGEVGGGVNGRRIGCRIVVGVDFAATRDRGGIDYRGRRVARYVHRESNRRVTAAWRQNVATEATHGGEVAKPAKTEHVGCSKTCGQAVRHRHFADRRSHAY